MFNEVDCIRVTPDSALFSVDSSMGCAQCSSSLNLTKLYRMCPRATSSSELCFPNRVGYDPIQEMRKHDSVNFDLISISNLELHFS